MKTATFLRYLLVASLFIALSTITPTHGSTIHGLYVNDFKNIIGQTEREDSLLQFAQNEGFNYLLLYNLYHIDKYLFDITDPITAQPLADFIEKAKTNYGIIEVGAVGETSRSFVKIDDYNATHENPLQQIDVYNMEFEFWNKRLVEEYYCPAYLEERGLSCSNKDAFNFYYAELRSIKKLARQEGKRVETYIGTPSKVQCQKIGEMVDRVLVHFYRKSDTYNDGTSIYNYNSYRLEALAPMKKQLSILPIFSNRANHMGPWLAEHEKEEVFHTWLYGDTGYEEEQGEWKATLTIEGDQWYRYTDFADANYLAIPSSMQATLAMVPPANEALDKIVASSEKDVSLSSLEETKITAFPNPVIGGEQVYLSRLNSKAEVLLFDRTGRIVRKYQLPKGEHIALEVGGLANGWYALSIRQKRNQQQLKLFIEQ